MTTTPELSEEGIIEALKAVTGRGHEFLRLPFSHIWTVEHSHAVLDRESMSLLKRDSMSRMGRSLIGDDYPTVPDKPAAGEDLKEWKKRHTQEFFILLPSTPEDYADVYDGVIQGLVEDYQTGKEEGERANILQALCALGESSLLLENISAIIPATANEKKEKKQNEKKWQAKQEKSLKEAIEETQRSLVEEGIASAPASAPASATAALADVATVTPGVGEDPIARELEILKAIESQNEAARKAREAARAGKQAAWADTHSGKGGGGASAAATTGAGAGSGGAGSGSGSSSARSMDAADVSINPAKKVMKWKYAVNYIKEALKKAGVAATLVKETGSSHFRLEAADPVTGATATDTLVYQHGARASGGYGSWYQEIVGRVLSNLGKTPGEGPRGE